MKISKSTIQAFNALANINATIKVHKGNTLRIRDNGGNAMAYAKINDEFEHEFVIYDIQRFISALNLVKDAEIEFLDKYLVIKNDHTELKFVYGYEETVVPVPESLKFPTENNIDFELSTEIMENLAKGSSLFGLKHIAVVSEKGSTAVHIKTYSIDNTVQNDLTYEVGETDIDSEFTIIYQLDRFTQMIKGDYKCTINPAGISRYIGETIEYYITIDRSSTYNK